MLQTNEKGGMKEEMSKLYCWVDSDTGLTTRTKTGNKKLKVQVNYGSKHNSNHLVTLNVSYESEPKVLVNYKGGLKHFKL